MEQPVGVKHGVAQPDLGQRSIEALIEGTLREPDALGSHPQESFVLAYSGAQLPLHRLGWIAQQRQVAMGGTAGDQIKDTGLQQLLEAAQHLALMAPKAIELALEMGVQFGRCSLLFRGAALQKQTALLDPWFKALLQHRIAEQREQCGGEAHGEPGAGSLAQRSGQ